MDKDLSNYRKSYEKGALLKSNVPENPLELFQKWFLHLSFRRNQYSKEMLSVNLGVYEHFLL